MQKYSAGPGNATLQIIVAERRHDVRSALKLVMKELLDLELYAELSTIDGLWKEIKRKCPDILLIDEGLLSQQPEEECLRIRSSCPSVSLILMTSSKEYGNTALAYGVDDYVIKGEAPEILVRVLKKATRNVLYNKTKHNNG